jgi:hypothetical protein
MIHPDKRHPTSPDDEDGEEVEFDDELVDDILDIECE